MRTEVVLIASIASGIVGRKLKDTELEISLLLVLILSWAIYNFGPQNPRFVCMDSHKLKDELVFISTKYFYAYVPPKSLVVNLLPSL